VVPLNKLTGSGSFQKSGIRQILLEEDPPKKLDYVPVVSLLLRQRQPVIVNKHCRKYKKILLCVNAGNKCEDQIIIALFLNILDLYEE
jgi:hypothetical protein